jgi:hypothetical protein
MMLGLNQYLMITCDKCNSGIGIGIMHDNNSSNLNDEYKCPCGNTFTYLEGLINDFCADHIFSEYNFISNIYYHGSCTITIGSTHVIKLKQEVPIINKIFLTPYDFVYLKPLIINDNKSIKIVSSEITDIENYDDSDIKSLKKAGDKIKISWALYGRTNDLKFEPWRQLIIQAKEELIHSKYLLSYLSSATALESFLNSCFSNYLKDKGINEQGIDIFLKESNMPEKIFILSKSLLNIDIQNLSISKKELERLIVTRNKIAHGKIVDLDKEKATIAFRNVITTIFEIELGKFGG